MSASSRTHEINALSRHKHRAVPIAWLNLPAQMPDPPRLPAQTLRWFALGLLGGYLLFCHGCHGDEDNELLAAAGRQHWPSSFQASQGRGTSIGTGCASICTC
jgi:hypothetical protein